MAAHQDISTQDVSTRNISTQAVDGARSDEVVDWTDLGRRMWSFLTGREAAIHYAFEDVTIEVPRDTGPRAPRATWKVDGRLSITTTDNGEPVPPGAGK